MAGKVIFIMFLTYFHSLEGEKGWKYVEKEMKNGMAYILNHPIYDDIFEVIVF